MHIRSVAKRGTALLIIAILLLLSGCVTGMPGSSKDKLVSVVIWHYYNGPQKMAFDQLVNEFNETVGMKKGIVVEAFSQGNVNELAEKVRASAEKKVGAEEPPDIFAAYSDTVYSLKKDGLIAQLDSYLDDDERKSFVPGYLEEGFIDGNLYIFPVAKSTEVMAVNLTDWNKFAGATGAELTSLSTMEGVTAAAKQYYEWTDSLTPEPNDGKAFFGRDAMANYMLIGYRQITGKDFFKIQNNKMVLEFDQAAIRRLWDNYYVPFINGWFGAYGKFRSDDAKTGDIIALVGSTSGALYFPEMVTVSDQESYPIEADIIEAPIFEGGKKVAVQQGAGMAVIKSTPTDEKAAVEFLKWFTEPQRNINYSIASGYLPVRKEANSMEKIQPVLESNKDQVNKIMKVVLGSAIQTVNSSELYVSLPFEKGNEARALLETSMQEYAKRDFNSIQEQVAAGMPREEAIAPYLEDKAFADWYNNFLKQLRAIAE